ncbi:MAG TPA: M56 family metallopeptidase, partial [Pyrinomonadaceae bacterium]|nr:M56 family metallopeptidase [Pyrinomonadaceae bacterium]
MNTVTEVLLNFLLNAAWQLFAIALFALAADRLLRNASRVRHLIWVAALLLSLVLPLLSSTASLTRTNATALPAAVDVPVTVPANIEITTAPDSWSLSTLHLTQRMALMLIAIFLIAVAFRCFRMGRAWINTRRILQSATAVQMRDELLSVVRKCESAFGVAHCAVLSSQSLRTPATVGSFKPVLILPEQLIREADTSALTAGVGHELAHICRRDYLFNLIYELIFLPLSVHPAAHFIKQRITQTRELRCDELVAQRLLQPEVYAKSLVRLASWAGPLNQRTQSIIVGMADADILEVRVMSLLKKTRASVLSTVLLAIAAIVLLAIPCVAAAAFVFHFNVDTARAQEPSRAEQERQEVRQQLEKELRAKMEHQAQELTTAIQNETNAEVKAKLQRRLDELKEQMNRPIAVAIAPEGDKYVFFGNYETRQREEREVEAKQKAALAQLARISMDQAIQIATSKT